MTERAARVMADGLACMGQIQRADVELYALGIEVIVSSGVTAAVVMILGILLGNWKGAVAFLLCFMHIRNYSGGYHASTKVRCFLDSPWGYLAYSRIGLGLEARAGGVLRGRGGFNF